jgi:hypothetical protein
MKKVFTIASIAFGLQATAQEVFVYQINQNNFAYAAEFKSAANLEAYSSSKGGTLLSLIPVVQGAASLPLHHALPKFFLDRKSETNPLGTNMVFNTEVPLFVLDNFKLSIAPTSTDLCFSSQVVQGANISYKLIADGSEIAIVDTIGLGNITISSSEIAKATLSIDVYKANKKVASHLLWTAVDEISAQPTRTSDMLHFTATPALVGHRFIICSSSGVVLCTGITETFSTQNVAHLPAGVYYVSMPEFPNVRTSFIKD